MSTLVKNVELGIKYFYETAKQRLCIS